MEVVCPQKGIVRQLSHLFSRWFSSQKSAIPPIDLLLLGAALMAVQIWDAFLTARGVSRFGIAAEGNLLIRQLMLEFGCLNALIMAKSIAIVTIIALIFLADRVGWLPHALRIVVVIYVCAAIIPWSIILIGTS